jgi:hypothetical protein
MEQIIRAVPIPDKKSLDRYGNPTRWILRIVEPQELRGLIAFPRGFEVAPGREYVVEIIRREKNYAVVKLHEHRWKEYSKYEDAYVVKIFLRCECGAFHVQHVEKFSMPLVANWKSRWYVQYALELRQQAEKMLKNAPTYRYYYVAVRPEAVEKLFTIIKRRTLDAVESEICKAHETTIFDDESGKWRTVEAWRGAKDKSWLCTPYPPSGYVPTLGWIDEEAFALYKKTKEEAEKMWSLAEDILGQQIDVGQCMPGRDTCRRYASRLASFL